MPQIAFSVNTPLFGIFWLKIFTFLADYLEKTQKL